MLENVHERKRNTGLLLRKHILSAALHELNYYYGSIHCREISHSSIANTGDWTDNNTGDWTDNMGFSFSSEKGLVSPHNNQMIHIGKRGRVRKDNRFAIEAMEWTRSNILWREHVEYFEKDHVKAFSDPLYDLSQEYNSHLPFCNPSDIHIYKFYVLHTGEHLFTLTLADFSDWWYWYHHDSQFTARFLNRTRMTNHYGTMPEGFISTSIHYTRYGLELSPLNYTPTPTKYFLYDRIPDMPYEARTKWDNETHLIFNCGHVEPSGAYRISKWYRDFRSIPNVEGAGRINRHLLTQLKPILSRVRKAKGRLKQVIGNNLAYDSWGARVDSFDKQKAAKEKIFSVLNALSTHKSAQESLALEPPYTDELHELREKIKYTEGEYNTIRVARGYPVDAAPEEINIRAVHYHEMMKDYQCALQDVEKHYQPEVVISVCRITGLVHTSDLFNLRKHDNVFTRNINSSLGKFEISRDNRERAVSSITYGYGTGENVVAPITDTELTQARLMLTNATMYDVAIKSNNTRVIDAAFYLYFVEDCSLCATYDSIDHFATEHPDWYGTMCMLDYAMPNDSEQTQDIIKDVGAKHNMPVTWNRIRHTTEYIDMVQRTDYPATRRYYIYKKGEVK